MRITKQYKNENKFGIRQSYYRKNHHRKAKHKDNCINNNHRNVQKNVQTTASVIVVLTMVTFSVGLMKNSVHGSHRQRYIKWRHVLTGLKYSAGDKDVLRRAKSKQKTNGKDNVLQRSRIQQETKKANREYRKLNNIRWLHFIILQTSANATTSIDVCTQREKNIQDHMHSETKIPKNMHKLPEEIKGKRRQIGTNTYRQTHTYRPKLVIFSTRN